MPSVDHCMNKPSEMTTLSNSLEVFDTYKHREDKDSDEESFHLPLDDDETESKYQEPVKNGSGNETEDEILNKFDATASNFEPIDPQLEESLLNEEEEEKKSSLKTNGVDGSSELNSSSIENRPEKSNNVEPNSTKDEKNHCDVKENKDECKENEKETSENEKSISDLNKKEDTVENVEKPAPDIEDKNDTTIKTNDVSEIVKEEEATGDSAIANSSDKADENKEVPKIEIDKTTEEDKCNEAKDSQEDVDKPLNNKVEESTKNKNEDLLSEIDNVMESIDNKSLTINEEQSESKVAKEEIKTKENESSVQESVTADKCENSNDSSKNQNEDSEDLFDISIIRDVEEDNAESAYNEAHPEEGHVDENEEYDDRPDDKIEDDSNSDKANNAEEDEEEEEMDIDKNEDQLKHDDVDIEESNLKLDCDGVKDGVSDGEISDSGNRTVVQKNKEQVQDTSDISDTVKQSVITDECRLDEVTGNLITGDGAQVSDKHDDSSGKSMDVDSEDAEKRKSLKRTLSEENESGVAKKSRTEEANVEIKEIEKPKEKLPLRTLLSLSDFMKTRKSNKRLTMHDIEEFCLQKICEVIVHKSDLGDVHHQLKLQEQLIETMRKEIQQLTKQARDLEIVNKKLLNDLKQQNSTQKPLNPLKITRSVGLQVKFTPAFEVNVKRRQANSAIGTQKVQVQTANRGPRNIPNAVSPSVNRQAASPQKQQQTLPKPNTPLLSQALQQNRRNVSNDTNKSTTQVTRPKVADPKTGAPTASVIDLTDEDDKKDKNKNPAPKLITQKNITVPLRTTPVRVNATQSIRLTTSQGKVTPITSVVTSSAPGQVMYVVQSSPQNVLSPLGTKAVVVNFQSTNGVLTSTLNGSAVSVIPKQSNTIQLKTVSPAKTLPNNKIIKMSNKHPAPLPPPPVVRVSLDKPLKPIPPKPHLTIRKTDTGIILQWKMPYELDMYEVIASYQLYAYQETSALPSTDMWRKVGDVKALALPMACTLTQFADKNKYYFAVRPVDIHKRIGVFSEPEEISL